MDQAAVVSFCSSTGLRCFMVRTCLFSLAGAGAGFLLGCAIVHIAAGPQPASDTVAISVFVGVFLAGTGAIAGAIMGGVADLLAHFKRKEQASREAQDRDRPQL